MTRGTGSDAQLEALVRQYGRLISSVVRRITGRPGDLVGDDIEQKVLVSLWRQIEREQTIDHPASYIYRIAVREAIRVMRQETSRGRRVVTDGEAEAQPDSGPDPSESVTRREQREHIESSLAELLPERERAVRAHLAGFRRPGDHGDVHLVLPEGPKPHRPGHGGLAHRAAPAGNPWLKTIA